eukprot:scaffold38577_cov77-Cyclotella_meneghiniana.AAC.5
MPSRKKAQGKVRKAKQAAEARSSGNREKAVIASNHSGACGHLGEQTNLLRHDCDAANGFVRRFFIAMRCHQSKLRF